MPAPWSSQRSSRVLISAAALFWASCGSPQGEIPEATPVAVEESAPGVNGIQQAPAAPAPAPQPPQTFFRDGVNRAQSAVAIGQSAQSPDDWNLAASRWQLAAQLMQQVPSSDPNYATAQQKVREYQQNAASAQHRAKGGGLPKVDNPQAGSRTDGPVAQIPVLERQGGTPVVSVTLTGNGGSQSFPMLFDTGASLTLITPTMANAIGVVVVDQVTVSVADGRQVQLPIGYVDTLAVGGLVLQDILVAIGGDVGLLGQDVYGQYGISAGATVINLYE